MEFRVLGPLEVVDGSRVAALGGRRVRSLLACLLIRANEVVPGEQLIEELWGGEAGANALQVSVSRLRKALGAPERVVSSPSGYMLRVGLEECDRDVFERLAAEGRRQLAQSETEEAAATFQRALALWRGPPFVDFVYEPFAQAEIARLEEARLACEEERIEADLALGRHNELVGRLEARTKDHPLRERPRAQLMLALYRSGRQADALELYRITRELFDRELGIEPGPELRRIEAAILRQDAELDLPEKDAAAPARRDREPSEAPEPVELESAGPARSSRKTVTVLVGGLPGQATSRGRDPELRRKVGERSFEVIAPVLERHGAAVERLQDGRVMGVFGVPAAHEDDALRAVRAAVELRDAFAGRGETVAIGIDSGEVLAGDRGSSEPLVTGDAVEAAASLQSGDGPGEILIGKKTHGLVRDAIRAEALRAPERVGGVEGWRLLELLPGAPPFVRRFDAPLVGREGELAQLHQAFERARRERRAQLFTVFGEAGIGKTRLAQELARSLEDEASVLTGRCLSYGEGITYWPVREIIAEAAGDRSLRELLDGGPEADVVAARLESAIGSGTGGAVSEEIFWAVRKLIGALAHESPLVLVFEDVHWAEPTLLDLIEHLADWVHDGPLLIVCLARPELLDGRPAWAGGKLNASSILLEPLSEAESSMLIGVLAGKELSLQASRRIAEVAGGNPLFLEQMLALLAEGEAGREEIRLPPVIQALLAARLDRLEPEERQSLECASIEGEIFHVGAVAELSQLGVQEAGSRLLSLVRKELIRPEGAVLPGEEAFRFRHALIRDAAYEAVPKERRAELHERYAGWLEQEVLGDRFADAEGFLGYHLEQAYRYHGELGPIDEKAVALANRAAGALASAGRAASRRGDMRGAISFLERTRSLLAGDEQARLALAPDLGYALVEVGELDQAEVVLNEAIGADVATNQPDVERHAWLVRALVRQYRWPEQVNLDETIRQAEDSVALLEKFQDDLALTRAWILLSALYACRDGMAQQRAAERAFEHARRAGSGSAEALGLAVLGLALLEGPTPVEEGVAICRRLQLELDDDPLRKATMSACLAALFAMQGRLEEGRELMAGSRRTIQEFSMGALGPLVELSSAWRLETLLNDHDAAERTTRAVAERAREVADNWYYVLASVDLARVLCERGDPQQCLRVLDESERHPSPPDIEILVKRPAARALALARIGRLEDAQVLARDAVAHARGTRFVCLEADALLVLAEVLRLGGRSGEAVAALEEALALYERKGNVVSATKARVMLAELT